MKRETTISLERFNRAKQLFPGGVNSPVRAFRSVGGEPFVVERGEGAYLIDVDGNRYVDYINSWGPLVIGHAHPRVLAVLAEQAVKGTSYGASSLPEIELAELIMQYVPSLERLRFVNSGTEAGMAVARLARGFTKRNKILKFSGCYHGHADSFLVQAGSGVATLGLPDSPGVSEMVARDTLTVPFNDLLAVERMLAAHSDDCAAIILEPIVGNAGFIKPLPGFLTGLRELCDAHSVLLIFDEVMTGFRVDLRGAQGLFDIRPDLTMLGKVIGGGLPVGAFGGRQDIMEMLAPLGPVYQAGTLSGNPLAMVAGIATLSEWTKPGVFAETAACAEAIVNTMRLEAERNGIALTASSQGTMFGFFFHSGPVDNFEQAKQSDTDRFKRFFHAMLERGVYWAPSAFEAGFVSYAHRGEPLAHTLAAIRDVFLELKV
jgi:glutamate-1-semialdehyde 2,1-aminomutase